MHVHGLLIEMQTDIHEQNSIATQCNLLNAPPLELFPQVSTSLDESFATETETEEADLDTLFCSKQEDYTTRVSACMPSNKKAGTNVYFADIIEMIQKSCHRMPGVQISSVEPAPKAVS